MTTPGIPNRPPPGPTPAAERAAAWWLLGLVLLQIGCQLALLIEALGGFRMVLRTVAFAGSLLALAVVTGRPNQHPSRVPALLVLGVLALELFHPGTNTALAAVAHIALCLAILGPVFWVPRLAVTRRVFTRLIIILWGFHTLSAMFGLLQVYFPGRFQPALSPIYQDIAWRGENLKIELASGDVIYRPMGLTDTPGGASWAGLYATVFGMGFLALGKRWPVRLVGIAGMALGLFCLYLSQVRSILVMAGVVGVGFTVALAVAGRMSAAARVGVAIPGVGAAALVWALAVGGQQTSDRLATLVEANPAEVYAKSRGHFLEQTVTDLLPEYPLGAGLGRWGLLATRFGDPNLPDSAPLYVEIQWTAWLFDGGVPLILAYAAAIGAAVWGTGRIAFRGTDPVLAGWALLILAYDAAAFAVTFNAILFIGQGGLEFWVLNAAVFAAARTGTRQ